MVVSDGELHKTEDQKTIFTFETTSVNIKPTTAAAHIDVETYISVKHCFPPVQL